MRVQSASSTSRVTASRVSDSARPHTAMAFTVCVRQRASLLIPNPKTSGTKRWPKWQHRSGQRRVVKLLMRALVVDAYDSFVYVIDQYLQTLGVETIVRRNDTVTPEVIDEIEPDFVVLGPGPGHPSDAGYVELIQ